MTWHEHYSTMGSEFKLRPYPAFTLLALVEIRSSIPNLVSLSSVLRYPGFLTLTDSLFDSSVLACWGFMSDAHACMVGYPLWHPIPGLCLVRHFARQSLMVAPNCPKGSSFFPAHGGLLKIGCSASHDVLRPGPSSAIDLPMSVCAFDRRFLSMIERGNEPLDPLALRSFPAETCCPCPSSGFSAILGWLCLLPMVQKPNSI